MKLRLHSLDIVSPIFIIFSLKRPSVVLTGSLVPWLLMDTDGHVALPSIL